MRRLLRAILRRLPIQPFVGGRLRSAWTWGGYSEPGREGAFVAFELRIPHRLAIGVRVPGARAMRLVVSLIQSAHLGQNRVSPVEEQSAGWRQPKDIFAGFEEDVRATQDRLSGRDVRPYEERFEGWAPVLWEEGA